MKIALIFPPFWEQISPPIGIASIKACLQQKGHRVKAYDLNRDALPIWDEYKARLFFRGRELNTPFGDLLPFFLGFFMMENFIIYVLHRTSVLDDGKYRQATFELFNSRDFFSSREEAEATIRHLNPLFNEFYQKMEKYCEDMVNLVLAGEPEYVGCSCSNFHFAFGLLFLHLVKKKEPKVRTVIGGYHPSLTSTGIHDHLNWIDHVIVGEGEELFSRFLENPVTDTIISNDTYKTGLLNLNELPYPDFSDFDMQTYEAIPIEGSRGCSFNCTFCREAAFWKRYRTKTSERIREEMEYQSAAYGTKHFYFVDSLCNGMAVNLAKELIDTGSQFTWEGQFRIMKDPETLKLLAKGGLVQLYYGLESASPKILMAMNKKITVEEMRTALFETAKAGIRPFSFWLTGFPMETEEDFELTCKFIEENKNYLFLSGVFPFDLLKGGNAGLDFFYDLNVSTIEQMPEMASLNDLYTYKSHPPRSIGIYRTYKLYSHIVELAFEPHYLTSEPRINILNVYGRKLYRDVRFCIDELEKKNSFSALKQVSQY